MKLGFVSAILPDKSLEEVFQVAREIGYDTVEVMCWPVGRSDRRYAGVTHLDVDNFDRGRANAVLDLCGKYGVAISGLGYYPNPLSPIEEEATTAVEHLKKVMRAADLLGIKNVNTFIGRDPMKTVDANWPAFVSTFTPIIKLAEDLGLLLAIENCPMLFTNKEWPGGKNLAHAPFAWKRMFQEFPSRNFGLNYDPSHLIWQMIDPYKPIFEFKDRIFHVHAKDARVDWNVLDRVGVMSLGWHTPKLPGLGDCDWGRFFGALTEIRFNGSVCVEVEDRAFEHTQEDRRRSLVLSHRYLRQFVV